MNSENPSHHEANKMTRVLNGERLKWTIRVHKPDGTILEFQEDERPKVKWVDDLRGEWLCQNGYDSYHIMAWVPGSILLCEDNEPKKK
jgi:hypothetical protein